ncbi:MAG: VCBS repeat-containing protein [Deltaproteobacteria bacterium]|nr:VCBS repeat-containing protein [Deltaproteobacteria bacterium]
MLPVRALVVVLIGVGQLLSGCSGGAAGAGSGPKAEADAGSDGENGGGDGASTDGGEAADGGAGAGGADGGPGDSGAVDGADGAADGAADGVSDGADGATDGTDGATDGTDGAGDGGAPWALPARADTDHPPAGAGWAWGGGPGYPDLVDPGWPVVSRVDSAAGLRAALSAAVAGDIIWVEDDAAIDLTGETLCLPGGVWLAGGRGQGGPGGLLFTTAGGGGSAPMLEACGDGVRVTGLRLRGPDPETCPPEWPDRCPNDLRGDPNCAYCTDTAYGIAARGHDGLEVDNNELSGWTYAAVGVYDAVDVDVHHNHIHHGWREGLGYGVVIYGAAPARALIRWNRFDAMRHVVAGQGYGAEDYEARDNVVGPRAISHVFDMHGVNEATGSGSADAGGTVLVHRNTVLVDDQYSFVLRGRPTTGAWLYANCLAPAAGDAALQRYFSGNFSVDRDPSGASAPNQYGRTAGDCGTIRWCAVQGGTGPLTMGSASGTDVSALKVGDLDGDGADDVLGSDGSRWRWANPLGGSWADLARTSLGPSALALADLDGDGVDDVITTTGAEWRWSRGGLTSFATLRSSTVALADLRFGDFDGDGADDIFTTEGGRWRYYPAGAGAAVLLASSGASIADLAVADLDGDGRADVFTADGSRWRWSAGGAASWADLAVSSARLSSLALADVDGDGRADVLSSSGSTLRWSSGGRTSWATLRHQAEGLDALLLGDFDGDGADDLLLSGCL